MVSRPHQHSFLALDPHGFHRVAYSEWGKPSQHRVVICVHGLTRNCRDFDSLAASLAGHFRVVCMDVVGRARATGLNTKRIMDSDSTCLTRRVSLRLSHTRSELALWRSSSDAQRHNALLSLIGSAPRWAD